MLGSLQCFSNSVVLVVKIDQDEKTGDFMPVYKTPPWPAFNMIHHFIAVFTECFGFGHFVLVSSKVFIYLLTSSLGLK